MFDILAPKVIQHLAKKTSEHWLITQEGGPTKIRSKADGVPPLCTCPKIVTRVSKPKHLTTSCEEKKNKFEQMAWHHIINILMKITAVHLGNGSLKRQFTLKSNVCTFLRPVLLFITYICFGVSRSAPIGKSVFS